MDSEDSRVLGSPHPIFSAYSSLPKSIKAIPNALLDYTGIEKYLMLLFNSPLRTNGWFESYDGLPRGTNDEPLPWYSYSAIDFIEERIGTTTEVFEYGSGNSTRWYANRVEEVVAVEHDPEWAQQVRGVTPSNATVLQRDSRSGYIESISEYDDADVVAIDGEFRSDCAAYALGALSERGVVVWDDTHNDEFSSGYQELRDAGFKELSFQGMGPVTATIQRTSIFYREKNCFSI